MNAVKPELKLEQKHLFPTVAKLYLVHSQPMRVLLYVVLRNSQSLRKAASIHVNPVSYQPALLN